jgi:hypothetical protein
MRDAPEVEGSSAGNPRARAFYEQLGFARAGETDTHDLMEWAPR